MYNDDVSARIDTNELAAWVAAMVTRKHGFALDAGDEARVREVVNAAADGATEEIVIAVTVTGPSGPVAIEERMTRTAAENLFAPAPNHERRDDFRVGPVKRAAPTAREASPPDSAGAGDLRAIRFYLGLIAVLIAAAIVAGVVLSTSHHHDEHEHEQKREAHH